MTTRQQRAEVHAVLTGMRTAGRLTPANVVEEARKPESPLHGEFTWDRDEAASKWLLQEARQLIAGFTVQVIRHETVYNVQEFVESPIKAESEQGYVHIREIMDDKQMARKFMDRELGMASTYVSKTKDYAEVLGLRKKVEGVTAGLDELIGEVRGGAQ